MKPKKRLQALVLGIAMLTALCGSLPAVSAAEPLPGPYQASKAYVANGDSNPVGPWQWNYYDKTEAKYEKLPYFISGGRGFSIVNNYNNCTAVDQYVMYADMRGNGVGGATEDAWTRYYPVRTFTAPNSGNITISAGSSLTGGGTYSGPNVRIMLEHSGEFSQVWPSEGWQVVKKNAPVNFEPLARNITAGDKLHFELSSEHLAAAAINTGVIKVNWDPVVTYNSLSFVMPEYQASEAYVANGNGNPVGPWQWNYYDKTEAKYEKLPYFISSGRGFSIVNNYNNCTAIDQYVMYADMRENGVGGATEDTWTRYYPVRTFTAPNSGNITISAGSSLTGGGAYSGPNVRIMLEHSGEFSQVWPSEGWQVVKKNAPVNFEPHTRNITAGDKLHFELSGEHLASSAIKTGVIKVNWDPKIIYNSYMEIESFLPEDANRVTLDQIFALTAKNAISGMVTAEDVSITGGSGNASVKTVTMTNENKTISFSFDGLEFGKSYTVTIKDPADTTDVLYQFTFTTLNVLYTSNKGTENGDGTTASPLSFQKALEQAKDGEKIIVMDEIVLPADFVWPKENKSVTVSGEGFDGAALNICQLTDRVLNINTGVIFENLELASTATGPAEGKSIIRACGNVVTIAESVTTRGIFGAFYGGAANNWSEVAKTEAYVYGGNFINIYGGGGHVLGDCKLTVGGNTNRTAGVDPSDEKNTKFNPIIYGGTLDNTVEGNCITTITGNAGAQYLYGGSLDLRDKAERGAGVKGKTVLNIQGGKFMNVFGMNPPSPNEPGGTVDYSSDVTINMTGGTVEALIGSSGDTNAASINASITINATGGTVTRRIIGGIRNEDGHESNSGKFITGDINVVIGSGLQGFTDKQPGHGIFGGSRILTNPRDENAKLIFLDGSYDVFKKHINADTLDCKSHHDYLITGTQGGTINPKAGNAVEIIPLDGYTALSDTSVIESGNYTLNQARTDVTFSKNAVYSLSGTVAGGTITASVGYISENNTNVMILALYDGNTLAVAKQVSVVQGQNTAQETMPYTAESGKAYTLKAFFWKDMEGLVPLCKEKIAEITAQ